MSDEPRTHYGVLTVEEMSDLVRAVPEIDALAVRYRDEPNKHERAGIAHEAQYRFAGVSHWQRLFDALSAKVAERLAPAQDLRLATMKEFERTYVANGPRHIDWLRCWESTGEAIAAYVRAAREAA